MTAVEGTTRAAPNHSPLLSVEHLTVAYGAFRAVSDVTFEVDVGQVLGVIGPNGAGKSTLIDAVSGFTPHGGSVRLGGTPLDRMRPSKRSLLGLTRTFQTAQLFDTLTVKQNVTIVEPRARLATAGRTYDAARALDSAGLTDRADIRALNLSGGERKMLELARALAQDPKVLILDEPIAGVPLYDHARVASAVRNFVSAGDRCALVVEHNMEFLQATCNYFLVLNFGEVIAAGEWSAVSSDAAVITAYLGTRS